MSQPTARVVNSVQGRITAPSPLPWGGGWGGGRRQCRYTGPDESSGESASEGPFQAEAPEHLAILLCHQGWKDFRAEGLLQAPEREATLEEEWWRGREQRRHLGTGLGIVEGVEGVG